jgi:hypothetical protein
LITSAPTATSQFTQGGENGADGSGERRNAGGKRKD